MGSTKLLSLIDVFRPTKFGVNMAWARDDFQAFKDILDQFDAGRVREVVS